MKPIMQDDTANLFYKHVDSFLFPLPFYLDKIIPLIFLAYLLLFIIAIFVTKLRHIKLRYMSIVLLALLVVSVMANIVQIKKEYLVTNWQKNICFGIIEVPYPYELDKSEKFTLPPFTFNKLTSSKNQWFFAQEVVNTNQNITLDSFVNNWTEATKKGTGFNFQKNQFKSINLNGYKVDYFSKEKLIFTSDFIFQINNKFYIITCNEQEYCFDEGIDFVLSQVRKL